MRNRIINLILVLMLAGCSSVPTNTLIMDTTSPISPPTDAINTATPVRTATLPATATTRPTETQAPYPFEVTAEKLNHRPADFEYLRTHLNEFVQAPSPWEQGVETFEQWIDEELDPVLGSVDKWVPNVVIDFASSGSETANFSVIGPQRVIPIGDIPFFYFLHNGVPYPVYILNGQQRGTEGTHMSIGVIPTDGIGNPVSDTMRDVYNGDVPFKGATVILDSTGWFGYIPDEIALLIQYTGFGRITNDAPRRTRIGFGTITFRPLQ